MSVAFRKSIKYFSIYYSINVLLVMLLSSLGTFFHFLLQHEMSIIESWLHQNKWEILFISKVTAILLLRWWFDVKLYQLKSFSDMRKDFLAWPKFHAVVVSFFSVISFAAIGKIYKPEQSFLYGYQFLISTIGVVTYFFLDVVVITYIEEIFLKKSSQNRWSIYICYSFIFWCACMMCIPDYYKNNIYFLFIFLTLLVLYGDNVRGWGNALGFLFICSAPIVSLFGVDPVWGDDFSVFSLQKKPSIAFLVVIWMISFLYYNHRESIIIFGLRLLRWSKRYARKS